MKNQNLFLLDNTTNEGKPYIYLSDGKFKNSDCSDGCLEFPSKEEGEKFIKENNISDWAYIGE